MVKLRLLEVLLIWVPLQQIVHSNTEVLRPRGVPLAKSALYDASKPFRCFDGSNEVPFSYVNDDYCDCLDGSDEPGTAACSQSFFSCVNRGYKSFEIPSSRVNDGVCDCCDGSDEYDDRISCPNICMEMGRQMREDAQRQMETIRRGYQKRQEYIEAVKNKKSEKSAAYENLEKKVIELETSKDLLTKARDTAEEPEKAAIAQHKELWEIVKKEKNEQRDRVEADKAFREIAGEKDSISGNEILSGLTKDGEDLGDDLKEALSSLSMFRAEDFISVIWPKIKTWYKSNQSFPATEAPPVDTTVAPEPDVDAGYDPEYTEEDHEDAHEIDRHDHELDDHKTESQDDMPEYSSETKQLIESADKARQELKSVEDQLYQLNNEKNSLKKWLDNDYGPDYAFAALEGECFEYTDREYTYKMCPFGQVSQRPKDGGSETGLGNWGNWEDGYQSMKFKDGARCWNGPSRSTKVRLECGEEHQLNSATEPSRCEYEMVFRTPVICNEPAKLSDQFGLHDEL